MITLLMILSFKHIASVDAVAQPNTLIVYSTPSGEVLQPFICWIYSPVIFQKQTMIVSDEHLAEKRIMNFNKSFILVK
ncbi:hypothetical protein ACEQPO_03240 [Bacillus sp. SL00103]